MISEILPVFARKPIFGYRAVAFSSLGIAFISMLVWAHHMFTVGLATGLNAFFMIATYLVAIPTGIKVLNWVATLWKGNIVLRTPMLYALGLIALFIIGGLSGIVVGNFPVDYQVHDSYYVVAHFHYTLFGGMAFGIFAGLYYWFPKMTGRMYDERLGKLSFWLLFVGFNLTFIPQHMLGLLGMPRRVYTYESEGLLEIYNLVSTIGAFIMGRRDPRPRREHDQELAERPAGRERPVAGGYPGVVRGVAPAEHNFDSRCPTSEPPPPPRSPPASRRSAERG